MAQVDFSNASLSLVGSAPPFSTSYVNLNTATLRDVNGNAITTNNSITFLENEQDSLLASYTGVFIASGTEFYIYTANNIGLWKISNISFQNGDAYTFQMPVTLTCN